MKINVTLEDIRHGGSSGYSCPIALAVRRTAGLNERAVYVGPERVVFKDGYDSYDLPITARQFIANFDEGRPVAPFSFYLPGNGELDDQA